MIPGRPEPTALDDAWALVHEPPPAPADAAGAPVPEVVAPVVDFAVAGHGPDAETLQTVGVVFVHGIGAQLAAETLFDWTGPIVRTVWSWAEQTADPAAGRPFQDPVEIAEVDLTGATTPIIQLRIPPVPGHDAQRWVLTEAWWAADVRPPGLSNMLDWLFGKGEVRCIMTGIVSGLRRNAARRGTDPLQPDGPLGKPPRRGIADALDEVAISALFILLTTVVVPLYGLLRVLGSLPIPKLHDAVSTAQIDWFIQEWFGDVRVLLSDRAQAANLRSVLAKTIRKLRCYGADSIVIVGHSGGTVLSYMFLADPEYDDLDVDKFISHGQALGLAWYLGDRGDNVSPAYDLGLRPGDRLLRNAHHDRPDGGPSTLRWVDFHASHDPAPAFSADGWPRDKDPAADGPDVGWTVYNRMSVRNDHGGYWDNDEQFVIPLLRELDTPGASADGSRFFPTPGPQRDRVLRRASRVRGLARWWNAWMVMLVLAVVGGGLGALIWGGGFVQLGIWSADILRPLPFVGLAATITPGILGAIVIVVAFAFHGTSAIGDWNKLDVDEREQARLVEPGHVSRANMRGQFVLYLVACLALIALSIVPHPVTVAVAIVLAVAAHGPAQLARGMSFAGGWFDPSETMDRPSDGKGEAQTDPAEPPTGDAGPA